MIKTSILARKLDFASMGDLRDDIVTDIERLEAIEETFLAINKECEKADAAPVKELLKYDNNGSGLHVIIDNATKLIVGQATNQGTAERLAAGSPTPCSVVRVLAPSANGNCPTQYIDGVQLDCEIEWAIYGTVGKTWLFPLQHADGYTWGEMVRYAKRFATKVESHRYITVNHIKAAIPFPVPKIKEAK